MSIVSNNEYPKDIETTDIVSHEFVVIKPLMRFIGLTRRVESLKNAQDANVADTSEWVRDVNSFFHFHFLP
jgi:hypothetical protein